MSKITNRQRVLLSIRKKKGLLPFRNKQEKSLFTYKMSKSQKQTGTNCQSHQHKSTTTTLNSTYECGNTQTTPTLPKPFSKRFNYNPNTPATASSILPTNPLGSKISNSFPNSSLGKSGMNSGLMRSKKNIKSCFVNSISNGIEPSSNILTLIVFKMFQSKISNTIISYISKMLIKFKRGNNRQLRSHIESLEIRLKLLKAC